MTEKEFKERYKYDPSTDRLGKGGFGTVYKADDTYRNRWVALKIAKVELGFENIRLKKEVELIKQLPVHRNIAYYEECYTFESFDGEYDFGILQYYEEGNLLELQKRETLTNDQKGAIIVQILNGLDFLHKNGIIHRDLKPQNILIAKSEKEYIPKITDFGISKKLDIDSSSIFHNSLIGAGTLAYSSPEQVESKNIRKNADLWGLAVVAFQLFSGKLPFTTGTHDSASHAGRIELMRQINNGQLPDTINTIPEPWRTFIRRCIVPEPDKRVKNVPECKDILEGRVKDSPLEEDKTVIEPLKTEPKRPAKPQPEQKKAAPPHRTKDETEPLKKAPPKSPPKSPPKPPDNGGKSNRSLFIFLGSFSFVLILILGISFYRSADNGSGSVSDGSAMQEQDSLYQELPARETAAPAVDAAAEERRRQTAAEQARQTAEQKARDLQTARTNAERAFLNKQYSQALAHYRTIKSLEPGDNSGYNRFLGKAKELAGILGEYDNNVKALLLNAKALRNTSEVNELLAKCN